MIGAVLLYAQTYTDKELDDKTAHAKRTQIIKSLVMERKVVKGELVFSFGGSLRYIHETWSGRDTGVDDNGKFGPLSVPIGFALDWYWKKSILFNGVHLDFNIIDLGQFTSFENVEGEIEKPVLSDIIAPSITASLFILKKYPVYIGASYGYSPKYYNAEDNTLKKGSFNFGITMGIYIPLLDFK